MPIKITDSERSEEVAWLCDQSWDLPTQIDALNGWLKEMKGKLNKSGFIADLGFMPRPDAAGGGAVINKEMMELMLGFEVELHLSEYPPDDE